MPWKGNEKEYCGTMVWNNKRWKLISISMEMLLHKHVKTTNPKKYRVCPNTGVVLPGTTCDVTVTMQAQKEVPLDMQCKDKFLVQSFVASTGATVKDITPEMFNKEPGQAVEEFKLRVIYVPANPASPVPEGSEEGSSPRASLSDNGNLNLNASLVDATSRSLEEPKEKSSECLKLKLIDGLVYSSLDILKAFEKLDGFPSKYVFLDLMELYRKGFSVDRNRISSSREAADSGMSSGDLLSIHPTELKFPFELKKQSSCLLQLTNKTDQYIAFKVKTTNPKKYRVCPNTGVVLPGTTCDVTVTMQAQKEVPLDMQCKDKFLVQSFVASTGATVKDITPEMFNKEPGQAVEEFKLRVIYVPANPASPVPEGSEEGSSPRASLSDNGNLNLNASLVDADSWALGHEMPSSSKPEQTRTTIVLNGGSGLTPEFLVNSNSRSSIIFQGNVGFHYNVSTAFLIAGSGGRQQYQAENARGGTGNQGDVPLAGGGALGG
ncbi:putative major sperm protein MSP domain-containing protein [Cinnamomum micranthum f. kanehirae]|uniref:Putative major sperm protein MSP domain-containing protein n=1 Tax=Cinnamomum micranthum f. kanehirae TaxID=337451 RepID=A0A3S3NH22_9MAGN|nr:putative major sperm protein MSP domain-containing protein [Cinnamomum micranthum f. kanehirae]